MWRNVFQSEFNSFFFSFSCWQDFFFFFFGIEDTSWTMEGVFQPAKTFKKRNTQQRTNANSFRATVGAPPREKILRRADDDGDDDDDDDSKKNALLVRVLHVFFSFFSSTRNVVTIINEEHHIRFLFWSSTKQLSRDDE